MKLLAEETGGILLANDVAFVRVERGLAASTCRDAIAGIYQYRQRRLDVLAERDIEKWRGLRRVFSWLREPTVSDVIADRLSTTGCIAHAEYYFALAAHSDLLDEAEALLYSLGWAMRDTHPVVEVKFWHQLAQMAESGQDSRQSSRT